VSYSVNFTSPVRRVVVEAYQSPSPMAAPPSMILCLVGPHCGFQEHDGAIVERAPHCRTPASPVPGSRRGCPIGEKERRDQAGLPQHESSDQVFREPDWVALVMNRTTLEKTASAFAMPSLTDSRTHWSEHAKYKRGKK
jgi:hypothetical protein